ncbi:hypothetical protein JHK82_041743 [Glycine max]|nr:hypothetical protein JHK85_042415 [Glycine max]KAG5104773.1 hypothetical protein JHK82_041743 [Glycine max]KAG5115902.1 hypothetical protein JHK84_042015 [Glycine max]
MKTQRIRLGSGSKKHTEIRIWKPVAITTCPLWRSGCAAVITQYYRLPRNDTGGDCGGGAGGVHGVAGESAGAGFPFRPCPSTGSFSHPPSASLCFFSS